MYESYPVFIRLEDFLGFITEWAWILQEEQKPKAVKPTSRHLVQHLPPKKKNQTHTTGILHLLPRIVFY